MQVIFSKKRTVTKMTTAKDRIQELRREILGIDGMNFNDYQQLLDLEKLKVLQAIAATLKEIAEKMS